MKCLTNLVQGFRSLALTVVAQGAVYTFFYGLVNVRIVKNDGSHTMNEGYGIGFLRNFIEVYLKGNPKGIKL